MANVEKVQHFFEPPPPDYVLTLTEDEAHALATLTGFVAGDRERSARKFIDNVREAFGAAGLEYQDTKFYPKLSKLGKLYYDSE